MKPQRYFPSLFASFVALSLGCGGCFPTIYVEEDDGTSVEEMGSLVDMEPAASEDMFDLSMMSDIDAGQDMASVYPDADMVDDAPDEGGEDMPDMSVMHDMHDMHVMHDLPSLPEDWALPGFPYRAAIRVSTDTVTAAPVTSLPVPVRLDALQRDLLEAREDGSDLRLVDAGDQVIPIDIESFSNTSGGVFWVVVPSLEQGAPRSYHLYWGGDPASSLPMEASTWGEEHILTLHMTGRDGAGAIVDSAPPEEPNDHFEPGLTNPVGVVGEALGFPVGSARGVTFVTRDAFWPKADEVMFIDYWVRPDAIGAGSRRYVFAATSWCRGYGGYHSSDGFLLDFIFTNPNEGTCDGSENEFVNHGTPSFDQWHHYTLVIDRSDGTLHAYHDGQLVESGMFDKAVKVDGASLLNIGEGFDAENRQVWIGRIDEFRILRHTHHDPDWILLNHEAIVLDMATISPTEDILP